MEEVRELEKRKIKVTYTTITELLSHGGVIEGKTKSYEPELRLPELKASLRYWWRVTHPQDSKRQRQLEGKLFGSTDNPSPIRLRCVTKSNLIILKKKVTVGKFYDKKASIIRLIKISGLKGKFIIEYTYPEAMAEDFKSILMLSTLLGGIGNRARRGYGVLHTDCINNIESPKMLGDIIGESLQHTNLSNNTRYIEDKWVSINIDSMSNWNEYNYIKSIYIGNACPINIFKQRIKDALYEVKELNYYKKLRKYETDYIDRYACPVYVSCYCENNNPNRVFPIITILNNTTKDRKKQFDDTEYVNTFKEVILQ